MSSPYSKLTVVFGVVSTVCLIALFNLGTKALAPGDVYSYPGPKFESIAGTEVVWEAPIGKQPTGVLFLAHGCSHGAPDFWHRSQSCQRCTGLPEEMNISRTARDRGYFVVAISSQDRTDTKCWNLPPIVEKGMVSDVVKVSHVLDTLIHREGLRGLPVYAMGASSGGAFVLFLAAHYKLQGVCSQIMGLPGDMMTELIDTAKVPFPPTMLVHMPKDDTTARRIKEDLKVLQEKKIPSLEVEVHPAALSPTFLSDVIGKTDITPEQSKAIYDSLLEGGFISDQGFLLRDPRRTEWRQHLRESGKVPDFHQLRMHADMSPIFEQLNLLWANHEIVSAPTSDMLDFFEMNTRSK